MNNLSAQTKVVGALGVVVALIFGSAIVYQLVASPDPVDPADLSGIAVRADSNRLSEAPDAKVTLVEFLDFECESCAAAYPFVEQLREDYADQVTFVIRYFPIPSHRNAENAAYAVESAARQGQLEAMYRTMYDTQEQWGDSQDSKADLFRTYAEDLGLDMATYDVDVASDEVAAKVRADSADGRRLGVSGTPTFFLDGERLAPATTADFVQAIEDALAQ